MREEYFGSTYLYWAHPWKLEEEDQDEEDEDQEKESVQTMYDIFKKIRNT